YAAREIMPRGNRAKSARVVGETGQLGDPGRLRRPLEKTQHPLDGIMEPPGRAEPNGGIVAGKRCQLAAVGRFVQREENQRKITVAAIGVQKRAKIARKLGGNRDVAPAVGAEAG